MSEINRESSRQLGVEWPTEAACKQQLDVMFPKDYKDSLIIQQAKKICEQCVVIDECLEHALAEPEIFGIWGGKTPRERDRLKRQRAYNNI